VYRFKTNWLIWEKYYWEVGGYADAMQREAMANFIVKQK
jgi:hypothetical protein